MINHSECFSITRQKFGSDLWCYAPGMITYHVEDFSSANKYKFPGVSITGTSCQLQCDHCNSKLLETMFHVNSPQELLDIGFTILKNNGTGLLITGGSNKVGQVPLDKYIPTLKNLKDMGLTIVIHTGLVTKGTAKRLGSVKIDSALIDIIGDIRTIEQVYHLDNVHPEDYFKSIMYLKDENIDVSPHIIIGLHYGEIRGEYTALNIVKRAECDSLIFVVLDPLKGTVMENITSTNIDEIISLIATARLQIPAIPLILGCARPRGEKGILIEKKSIDVGISGIAYPSEEAIDYAKERGLTIKWSEKCCSMLYRDIIKKKE